jgi:hypothetical protein
VQQQFETIAVTPNGVSTAGPLMREVIAQKTSDRRRQHIAVVHDAPPFSKSQERDESSQSPSITRIPPSAGEAAVRGSQIVFGQSSDGMSPFLAKLCPQVPNRIQLEIDRVDRVATTESPGDKVIEEATKDWNLAIMLMIPRANMNREPAASYPASH